MSEKKQAAPMNPVVHFEMPYENRERLRKFYQKAFGWQMLETGKEMGDYVIAVTSETDENRMVTRPGTINGGFFPQIPGGSALHPSVVIAVEDIKKGMKDVSAAGGKIPGEPMEIPGIGQYVSFTDTEGNRVGMLEPKNMDYRKKVS